MHSVTSLKSGNVTSTTLQISNLAKTTNHDAGITIYVTVLTAYTQEHTPHKPLNFTYGVCVYIYIYIYVYICMYVCVFVRV